MIINSPEVFSLFGLIVIRVMYKTKERLLIKDRNREK